MENEHEIEDLLLAEPQPSRRPCVNQVEDLLFDVRPVLGNGHVRVIDYMGDDAAIVQAARVSYGKGTKGVSNDRNLIRYLMRHRHTTPFEMCEIKLHIKAPIFVARQWLRHRMSSTNEYSARYSILDRQFYVPEPGCISGQSAQNKQGRGDSLLPGDQLRAQRKMAASATAAFDVYEDLINDESGLMHLKSAPSVSREIARTVLPVSTFTQWYWKIDLHNLLHFLSLRMDDHAQYEIRLYAEAIAEVVQRWVPLTWEAFEDYRLRGVTLSRQEWEEIKNHLDMDRLRLRLACGSSQLSGREVKELQSKLGLIDPK
jgi:thymidylate synthase (FAD)